MLKQPADVRGNLTFSMVFGTQYRPQNVLKRAMIVSSSQQKNRLCS